MTAKLLTAIADRQHRDAEILRAIVGMMPRRRTPRCVTLPPLEPKATEPGDDAELLRLADQVVVLEAAWSATFQPPATTLEEEERREPVQRRLHDLIDEAATALATLAPRTMPGILAKAKAAYALATKAPDGETQSSGIEDLVALSLIEDLVRFAGDADVAGAFARNV